MLLPLTGGAPGDGNIDQQRHIQALYVTIPDYTLFVVTIPDYTLFVVTIPDYTLFCHNTRLYSICRDIMCLRTISILGLGKIIIKYVHKDYCYCMY